MNEETMLKSTVHISRHWDNPQIKVAIHKEGIAIELSVEDFIKALVAEMSHPAFVMSRGGLEAKILALVDPVLDKIKQSSAHV